MNDAKDQRVLVMMSVDELRRIDDWRRCQGELPSRSEAIRQLIAAGLANKPVTPPNRPPQKFHAD
jgi:Arc/MetJ-type ribon-helix-helix transcriptional regulator